VKNAAKRTASPLVKQKERIIREERRKNESARGGTCAVGIRPKKNERGLVQNRLGSPLR
jgi:hypothetical protein